MSNGTLPGWIAVTQWASRGVLFILVGLSVWSVAIMVDRYRVLKSGSKGGKKPGQANQIAEARRLIEARNWKALQEWAKQSSEDNFWDVSVRLPAGTLRAALAAGSTSPDTVDRAVRSYLILERGKLEQGLTALATLGSNAPFIGLFGTVLGIIQAFGSLASQNSSSMSVMTGISEALVATAIGLFVAIPAVVAYNVFSRKMRIVLSECDSLRDFYLSRLTPTAGSGHGG